MSLGLGQALTAKKVSASCWSEVEAAPKQNPVITPEESTAASKLKPSYHPRLLDQPISAYPASHPAPRRLASRTGIAELSSAWYGHFRVCKRAARCNTKASRNWVWKRKRRFKCGGGGGGGERARRVGS